MNGNSVETRMLVRLRGERICLRKEKELRRQKGNLGKQMQQENARMPWTETGRGLNIPVSTFINYMQEMENFFRFTIVLKGEQENTRDTNGLARFEPRVRFQRKWRSRRKCACQCMLIRGGRAEDDPSARLEFSTLS